MKAVLTPIRTAIQVAAGITELVSLLRWARRAAIHRHETYAVVLPDV